MDVEIIPPKKKEHFIPSFNNMPDHERKLRTWGAIAIILFAIPIFVNVATRSKWFSYIYYPLLLLVGCYIGIDQYKKRTKTNN